MATQSFFDKLTNLAHRAGSLARQGVDTARQVYKDIEPTINTALDMAKTVTDKERRDQAIAQLSDVANRVVASGSSQLKYVMTQMQEGFNGVPSEIAVAIATYGTLAEAAEAKGALGLPEMIACGTQIELIKKTLAEDNRADVGDEGAKLEQLVRAAGTAVSAFASDEPSVRRLLVGCQSTIADIDFAETERASALTELLASIKDAQEPARVAGLVSVVDLKARLTEAEADVIAGSFPSAAIKLSNFNVDAAALLAATKADAEKLAHDADFPGRTRRLLGTLVMRANEQGKLKGDIAAAAQNAKELLKQRPCDLVAAREAFDLFEELAR